jgi:hypothetical protein
LRRAHRGEILEPVLHEAAESGEIRMLFMLTAFDGLEPTAWFDDIKTGLGLGIGHHSAWKRSAIVTDIDWIGRAFQLFAWMTLGEVKVYARPGGGSQELGRRLNDRVRRLGVGECTR